MTAVMRFRRRQLRSLDHQDELHQVLVDGRTARLDEEDVGARIDSR
jgi:hypothetical protein